MSDSAPHDTCTTAGIRADETLTSHGGFTFSGAMFYSPFATVPTGGPLDV
jgi:hypothetical protein